MNIDKYEKDDRLLIVSENYIFCDCDEGCENCREEADFCEEPWDEEE